jgi:hypothetical protein
MDPRAIELSDIVKMHHTEKELQETSIKRKDVLHFSKVPFTIYHKNVNGDFEKLNSFDELSVGGSGNLFVVEPDGTWVNTGEGTTWDEVSQPFIGNGIFVPGGRVNYDHTELTLVFAANARYPEEPVGAVIQAMHSRKIDSDIYPHIHWMQTSDAIPNILIAHRMYDSGEIPPTWTLKALTRTVFPFTGSGMQQITPFDLAEGNGVGLGLSFTIDVKIYRDSLNTSGLFAGADAYPGTWSAKYYDIHFEKDMNGSREEFVK